jgi:hypothetical protein
MNQRPRLLDLSNNRILSLALNQDVPRPMDLEPESRELENVDYGSVINENNAFYVVLESGKEMITTGNINNKMLQVGNKNYDLFQSRDHRIYIKIKNRINGYLFFENGNIFIMSKGQTDEYFSGSNIQFIESDNNNTNPRKRTSSNNVILFEEPDITSFSRLQVDPFTGMTLGFNRLNRQNLRNRRRTEVQRLNELIETDRAREFNRLDREEELEEERLHLERLKKPRMSSFGKWNNMEKYLKSL